MKGVVWAAGGAAQPLGDAAAEALAAGARLANVAHAPLRRSTPHGEPSGAMPACPHTPSGRIRIAAAPTSPFDERVTAHLGATESGVPVAVPLGLRLEWFERLRYQEVFLWSAGRHAPDERHSWTEVEAYKSGGSLTSTVYSGQSSKRQRVPAPSLPPCETRWRGPDLAQHMTARPTPSGCRRRNGLQSTPAP